MFNSQDIEARLCDYVEGELSESERAEIQRHLDAHPEHRQMIEELMRTRNLVRDLPHAKAPAELNESLHAQLERSMLLGDGLSISTPSPARRFSHVALLAATIFLAIGLAAAVYTVLRATSNRAELRPLLAQATPASTIATDQSKLNAPTTLPALVAEQFLTTQKSPIDLAMVPAMRKEGSLFLAPSPTTQPAIVAQTKDFQSPPMQDEQRDSPSPPDHRALYITVSASDSQAASATVNKFLTDNGISYELLSKAPATQPTASRSPTTLPVVADRSLNSNAQPLPILVRDLPRQKATDLATAFAKQNPTLGLQTKWPLTTTMNRLNPNSFGGMGSATRPVISPMFKQLTAGTALADSAGSTIPSTRPSAPSTQPAEDRLDMIITVNSIQPTVAASTRPAIQIVTAPAGASTTPPPTTAPVARPAVVGYSNTANESSGNNRK